MGIFVQTTNLKRHFQFNSSLPLNNCINLDIAGHYGTERSEEDLTVEDGVVEVRALDWVQTKQQQLGVVADLDRGAHALKEVECRALVELLLRMLENSEDDGLRAGEDEGGQVGSQHHHPGRSLFQMITAHYEMYFLTLLAGSVFLY